MKTQILGTGLSGLVGTRVVELLQDEYEFEDVSLATGVDISNYDTVEEQVKNSPAQIILHMAAKTDVDGCENDKILLEEGQAWIVNVTGTQNIAEAARRYGKHVIYVSTDFVFEGIKEYYTEEDTPDPVSWYAVTKYEGEKAIETSGISHTIVRLAYPYRAKCTQRSDFVRKIIEKFNNNEPVSALTDHVFTPTFIDDFAHSLRIIMQKKATGIYHLVGSQSLTPYAATVKIMEVFGLSGKIEKVKREGYFKKRAFRPCNLRLKNDKMLKLGFKMHTFDEGLEIMRKQLLIY